VVNFLTQVPQVLKKCAEFIEKYGIVDGIYRLSGITSNIQRLRQEFCSEACPDLTKEVYLQDIHCVGSLCKLYFRELPNPLLTYELYSKFTEAVSVQGDHERLLYLQRIIRELPTPHFRTLEYLTKHLAHLATLSTKTNMHTRNLALVWAPNLLRSKDIDSSSSNGDMAFQEVRIQQSVVEFILNHTEQIFSNDSVGQCGPMKLMSLEEAQARSLSPNHPVHKERQRENSLPDTSTATLYHTVIDISDSKRKFSGKSKKWKSIFNLGKSVDSKGKLSRNGSVFIRAQGITEKAALRPSRSMESLCSLPTDDDRTGHNSPAGGPGNAFVPDVKSRTLGSDSLYDLNEHEPNWEFKGKKTGGATGGWSSSLNQKGSPGPPVPPQKTLPEQLKVFKGDDISGYKPTSPKNRRMLYSGSSHNSSSRPSFPGSFFPLESSPRHQRRAVNISEPFAVSVPLRVSAVISSNSTPCRGHAKDKAAALQPCKDTSEIGSNIGKNLGHRCIRDISNQQNRDSSEFSSCQRGLLTSSGTVNNGLPSELELFLKDRQAPLRRNSAPVSVSSVRTAFMIKTCQAKAVPVVPPKVQYSQIPHSRHENDFDTVKEQDKEYPKMSTEKSNAAPPLLMSDLKEELENKEPAPKHQKHANVEKSAESEKTTSTPELPVITRRHAPSLEVFVDCPRPNKGNLLQRPSFRNRQRPQSLILLSPPFPIMDYPSSGDDGKLLSSIKSLNDTSGANVFSKEMSENFRTQEGITLQNKMTIPKSGQRLETSTSCFYQPQRRSMIFDSRSHRQIE
uniref:Rho GTPase activating protein 31 n=1 Tax=Mastacembelus armatus TaxID=205130 RepID=A0A7N9AYY9_9TELE